MRASLLLGLLFIAGPALAEEKFIGSNVDVRTVVSFKISDSAVKKYFLKVGR